MKLKQLVDLRSVDWLVPCNVQMQPESWLSVVGLMVKMLPSDSVKQHKGTACITGATSCTWLPTSSRLQTKV